MTAHLKIDFVRTLFAKAYPSDLDGTPLLTLSSTQRDILDLLLKRSLDIVISATALLLLLPVMLLAAIAVATELGVSDACIQQGLAGFQGIGRRFQMTGEINTASGRVLMIDDYGHHPRELEATLQAARTAWPERRLVVVFQPHRYSRTRDLFEDFARVLSETDVLLMLEVYAASEEPIAGADARTLCRAIRARGQVDPVFVERIDELPRALNAVLNDGDVLLTLGAGNIGAIAAQLAETLTEQGGEGS